MLILAPMQGLTEVLFRKTYETCYPGAFDYAVSPFVSLTHGNLHDAEKKIHDVLPEVNQDSMVVVPQILGHEKEEFVDLANRFYELGYSEVNWNMGCPMRRVAHKHRGSGILPYPEEVRDILTHVMTRIRPKLSVKVRLGYYSPDEIDHIIPVLNDFPLKDITIHPRIGKQQYSGRPDLEKLAQIVPEIRHRIIYNGDICTTYDYKKIMQLFPSIKDVMIGRGVLYNPTLPLQIRNQFSADFGGEGTPDPSSHCTSAAEFVIQLMNNILQMNVSDQAKGRKMKEYWCLASRSLPGTEERKRRVLHASALDEIFNRILEIAK